MKYIETPSLSRLSQALTHEGSECSVHTRIEAYSCKNIKRDKKLFRSLEIAYQDEVSSSPPLPSWMPESGSETTPFGPMDKHASRKTLYLLIATLNVAFPDHEFSDVRPAHFSKEESGASVLNALSTTLIAPHRAGIDAPRTYSSYPPSSSELFPHSVPTSSSPMDMLLHSPSAPPAIVTGTHPSIFRQIDDVIGLSECEVFSYSPDIEFDPHANDLSDDEDDTASIADEDSSSDDNATFDFDDYDVDEHVGSTVRHTRSSFGSNAIPIYIPNSNSKRRGALLWSSHWFFLNRKLKRILFISIWARTRSMNGSPWTSEAQQYSTRSSSLKSERFVGWEGAVGAGARALGLVASAA